MHNDDARIYPCAECGVMRSKNQGGTAFTVCDVCWDKLHPPVADQDRKLAQVRQALEMIRAGYLGQNTSGERVFTHQTLDVLDEARRI